MRSNRRSTLLKMTGLCGSLLLAACMATGPDVSYSTAPADFASATPASGEFGATQGGVQDMGFARELIANGQVPPPAAFTVEGLFSEVDLPLDGPKADRLFQLRAAPAIAPGPDGEPAAWVQIGLSSSLDVDHYQRPSLTLVACVDVSGSMGWDYMGGGGSYPRPGFLARKLLHTVAEQLGEADRLAIVTYGSTCHTVLPFVPGDQQETIRKAVDGLRTDGSTNMEAGLTLAYQQAANARFDTDQTRVLLFTDEQPNVGLTSATGFDMLVDDGAEQGVGLTVFGLGLGLGSELMKSMSHTRGANAFSLRTSEEVDTLMADSWPWMVSPIAYDLQLAIQSAPGFRLAESYGFPAAEEGVMPKLDVSTIFLSKRKGALLLCFQPERGLDPREMRFSADLDYLPPQGAPVRQRLDIDLSGLQPGPRAFSQRSVQIAVALAMLVTGMQDAAERYQHGGGSEAAMRAQQAVERFRKDRGGLEDDALAEAEALAVRFQGLLAAGAPQGELDGLMHEG